MNFKELERTWIIAEIGVNHEGDEECAADMIRLAADTSVDAVKFATFQIQNYISTNQPERRERISHFELSRDTFRRLAEVAKSVGLTFFSTPLHPDDADFLDEIEVRPSARDDGSVMFMHCVGAYPTDAKDLNLRNMMWLKDTFGFPVGLSDHTIGTKACELAVAMGAVAVEKHFTYRTENQEWHDHAVSADPKNMTKLVEKVRTAEVYLGHYARGADHNAAESRLIDMRRSPGALVDIPANTPIKREWLTWLRPAWGLAADDLPSLVGKTLNQDVAAGSLIMPDVIEGNTKTS